MAAEFTQLCCSRASVNIVYLATDDHIEEMDPFDVSNIRKEAHFHEADACRKTIHVRMTSGNFGQSLVALILIGYQTTQKWNSSNQQAFIDLQVSWA